MRAYYFGRWSVDDSGGHCLYGPAPCSDLRLRSKAPLRWPLHGPSGGVGAIDGLFAGSNDEQNACVLVHIHDGDVGWTIIAFADYTGDSRPGSNSAFIYEGYHDFSAMIEAFAQNFPKQHERATKAAPLKMRGT